MKTKSFSEAQGSVPGTLHVIETVIPGVRMIRTWQWRWLRAHLVAGVTIIAMLVQQDMRTAKLAGDAPVADLYSAIGAMVGYALFWEFTTNDDWYSGIFRDPGSHNAVAGRCQERVSE